MYSRFSLCNGKSAKINKNYKKRPDSFQRIRSEYWSSAIRDSPDSKTLWRRLNFLLHPTDASTCPNSPDAFAHFFDEKIEAIRQNTANAPQPDRFRRSMLSTSVPSRKLLVSFKRQQTNNASWIRFRGE